MAIEKICTNVLPKYPVDLVELVALHPLNSRSFEWTDLPACLKIHAEMRFHGTDIDDVYGTYGIEREQGVVAVVRPDGYIGMLSQLSETGRIVSYLNACLVTVG
jgi:phenol 2-monooxygenase (NADPH)